MSTFAPPRPAPPPAVRAAPGRRVGRWSVGLGVVGLLAAALRLLDLPGTVTDPFYDAAVRSMGGSWHALWTGALDPSGQVAIDKPPVDLWLQVASTRLFGFTTPALLLPAALGGVAGVLCLGDLVRTLAGPRAGVAAALALAVLPIAVVAARSDTMDTVMSALLVAAWAVAARGLRGGSTRAIVLAGVLVGLAFEVKLFEALVAVPGLAAMWWLGARGSRAHRGRGLGLAALAATLVGLAWLIAMPLTVPAAQRPFAFGSAHGSAWQSALVYDGWDRLTGHAVEASDAAPTPAQLAAVPGPPGPLRLLSSRVDLAERFGVAALAALLVAAAVGATGAARRLDRAGRAGAIGLLAWAVLGVLMASLQSGLRPRYLEGVDPAVAAVLGGGLALLLAAQRANRASGAQRRLLGSRWSDLTGTGPRGALMVLGGALVLAGLAVSVGAVARHAQVSGSPGALPAARLASLRTALRADQGTARYEVASLTVAKAGPIVAADGRPVLLLGADGRTLVTPARLASLVAAGAVRTALLGSPCRPGEPATAPGCSPDAAWIRAHGVDVSRAAGQPHPGLVYALSAPAGTG